jgi:hypothetical protein
MRKSTIALLTCLPLLAPLLSPAPASSDPGFAEFTWVEANESAAWDARAGLQVVDLHGQLYLMGGRTPLDPATSPAFGASQIWGDVWTSDDLGNSWSRLLETDDTSHWPARAYFQAVTKGPHMYVIGGQNFTLIENPAPEGPPFLSVSDFFNDVWRSRDGVHWDRMTEDAGWEGRAGLSATTFKGKLWVLGGSVNDDSAVIGGPPVREYFNDVWVSKDGSSWEQVTDEAPWAPRAGAIAIAKDGYLWLIGGEDGFTCDSGGDRCPPYFNDVWRSRDGENWELVTENAAWPSRPGHQVVVMYNQFVLFGGFGLGPDPTTPANPMDVWVSRDGSDWMQVDDAPWNASGPGDIKYDFDALVVRGGPEGLPPTLLTFGGDRETFNPFDPVNWLRVDNDVWQYRMPADVFAMDGGVTLQSGEDRSHRSGRLHQAHPNPFNPQTTISFTLDTRAPVRLAIYDFAGRRVATLAAGSFPEGRHEIVWNGRDDTGRRVASGVYLSQLATPDRVDVQRLVLVK